METEMQIQTIGTVPEIIFRSFKWEADYPNILAIITGSKGADEVERSDKLEDVVRNYSYLHNCDPQQDLLFAEVDGRAVGYCRCWWDMEANGQWDGYMLAFLLPEWRSKGIGTRFLRFMEERLAQTAQRMLAEGLISRETPCVYVNFCSGTEKARIALLEKNGYQVVRYGFNMVRPNLDDIPEAPMPEGLEVRPVLPEHYRPIWDASNEAFLDHWGAIPQPEEEYQNWLHDSNFNPSLYKVAWDGDQVAGMVQNFINAGENAEYNRKRGYTEGICVRRPWRRRGLARALIVQSLHELKRHGMTEAALGVDAQNLSGALHLYESLGYQVVKTGLTYHKPLDLKKE